MKLIAIIALVCCIGCTVEVEVSHEQAKRNQEIKDSPWEKVIHYEYDGCKWIKFQSLKQGAAVHDPKCPCNKER